MTRWHSCAEKTFFEKESFTKESDRAASHSLLHCNLYLVPCFFEPFDFSFHAHFVLLQPAARHFYIGIENIELVMYCAGMYELVECFFEVSFHSDKGNIKFTA